MIDFSENFEIAADICDRAEHLGFGPAQSDLREAAEERAGA